jgi:hypothetical protein
MELAEKWEFPPLIKPKSASSREARKIIAKLAMDISAFVCQSVNLLKSVIQEGGISEKKEY